MLKRRIVAYNISLRWSCDLWVMFSIYKHSAPTERLLRLIALCLRGLTTSLWLLRLVGLLRREIFFIDLIDHLQLRAKLLVTTEANFVSTLLRPVPRHAGK